MSQIHPISVNMPYNGQNSKIQKSPIYFFVLCQNSHFLFLTFFNTTRGFGDKNFERGWDVIGWYHQCRKRARGDPKNDNGMGCDIYPGSRSSTQNQLFLKTCFKVFCCEDLHNTTSRLHIFVYLKRNLPCLGNVSIKSGIEGLHQWGIRGNRVIVVLFDVPCYLIRGQWCALFGCLGCESQRS